MSESRVTLRSPDNDREAVVDRVAVVEALRVFSEVLERVSPFPLSGPPPPRCLVGDTDAELVKSRVSDAERLPDGVTLCDGDAVS